MDRYVKYYNKNWKIVSAVIVIIIAAILGCIFVYGPLEPMPYKADDTGSIAPYDEQFHNNMKSYKADDTGSTMEGINSVVSANNKFSLELYSNIKNKEKGNIFFSPYSISTALAMTYEGARGKTAKEIQSVFYFPEDSKIRRPNFAALYNKLNKKDTKYKLHVANALWVQRDYSLLDEYINIIEKYYGGKVTSVDFVRDTELARQTINKWVEKKTNNKIKDLFPRGFLTPQSRLVLTNAIYFKGTWAKKFNKSETRNEDFIVSKDQIVKVPMMRITDEYAIFNYTETEDLQMLEMVYEGEDLSMLVLLPKSNITSLEELLTIENLNKWRAQLREEYVNVFMPKFTLNTKYFLNENLKEMGMPSAFSPLEADFSGIDGTKSLFIQTVVHQAFVNVDEEGTEAAAATGVIMKVSLPQIKIFRADRPFIFIIQERKSGNILFIGRVIDPT